MGFIERLRQQKEAAAQARSKQDAELQRKREAETVANQQRETQERELHQQRRQQAEVLREESGIGPLVVELGRFLIEEERASTILQRRSALLGFPNVHNYQNIHGDTKGFSNGSGYTIAPLYSDWDYRSITYPSITPTDPDSVLDIVMWDFKGLEGKRSSRGRKGEWEEAEQKFLAVETTPDGDIVFHSRKIARIPSQVLKSNSGILDKTLEEAFHNPRGYRFEYRHVVPWEESS